MISGYLVPRALFPGFERPGDEVDTTAALPPRAGLFEAGLR